MRGRKQKEPAGMNPAEIFAALALLEKERGIPQSFMLEKIIQAIIAAYKKDHPGVENVIVDADETKQTLKMYVQKNVVDEEDYVDPGNEVPLAEAKRLSGRYEIGDVINFPVDNLEFGRIAAGNGKQVIIQGLREAERGAIYDEFNSKQHELLTGTVVRTDPTTGSVSVRIGTGSDATESTLNPGEQISGETLEEGMLVKVYVVDVRRSTRGPQILISRTHPGLVRRLFELEVPEIFDGTVEVKSLAREAGSRTKMAVSSNDPEVDPIGACVGPKGQRVAAVVEELRGEKIDIIKFSDNPEEYIAAALAPAEVVEVRLAPEGKACRVLVPDDQLSLAIGREGQNARLAARLTGYKIDIKPRSFREDADAAADAAADANAADGAAPSGTESPDAAVSDAAADAASADESPAKGGDTGTSLDTPDDASEQSGGETDNAEQEPVGADGGETETSSADGSETETSSADGGETETGDADGSAPVGTDAEAQAGDDASGDSTDSAS